MALSYYPYAIATLAFLALAGESVMLHCDSRPSFTASQRVCETQPMLGTSISSIVFFHISLSHKMMCTCLLTISHTFSISLICCFTCYALWDPRNYCASSNCNSKIESMECNAEVVRRIGDTKTKAGYPGTEFNHPLCNLFIKLFIQQMCCVKYSSFVTPLWNGCIADVTCCHWTAFAV